MLPENPTESGTHWKCEKCPHRTNSSFVAELVSTFMGRKDYWFHVAHISFRVL